MPNYCNNTLTMQNCDEPIVDVLSDYLKVTWDDVTNSPAIILDFQKIAPMPKELVGTTSPTPIDIDPELQKNLLEKCGVDNWHQWCLINWGTKWNSSDSFMSKSAMSFTTAWSPPCAAIATLAKLTGKDLRMTYMEEGMGFCGELYAYGNGTVVENEYNVSDAPEALLEELGYEEWEEV